MRSMMRSIFQAAIQITRGTIGTRAGEKKKKVEMPGIANEEESNYQSSDVIPIDDIEFFDSLLASD